MTRELDYSILQAAGITQTDFAELCGVSRVTVNLWVKGKMRPHRYLREQVEVVLDQLQSALAKKRLPITRPPGGRKENKIEALRAALVDNEQTV